MAIVVGRDPVTGEAISGYQLRERQAYGDPSSLTPAERRAEIQRLEILERETGGVPDVMGRGNIERLSQLRALESQAYVPLATGLVQPWEQEAARQLKTPGELGVFTQREQVRIVGAEAPPPVYKPVAETRILGGEIYIGAGKPGIVRVAPPISYPATYTQPPQAAFRPYTTYERIEQTWQPLAKGLIAEKPEWEKPSLEYYEKAFAEAPPTYLGGVQKGLAVVGYYGAAGGRLAYEYEKEWRVGWREQPVKTAAFFGAAVVLPGVLGAAGGVGAAGLAKTAVWLPRTTQYVTAAGAGIFKAVPPTVALLYTASISKRVSVAPTAEAKAGVLGRISATEVAPLIGGGVVGAKLWPKVFGRWETRGLKEYKVEEVVAPEVRAGKPFPIAGTKGMTAAQRRAVHLQLAKVQPYTPEVVKGYYPHTTKQVWKDFGFKATEGEAAAFISLKGVSPRFAKVSGAEGYRLYGGDLLRPYGRPEVIWFKPTAIKGMAAKPGYQFLYPREKGVAYVPGLKTEPEAVFAPTVPEPGAIPGPRFGYFEWGGVRIPMRTAEVIGTGQIAPASPSVETVSKLVSSYAPSKPPLITPGSLGAGAVAVSYATKPVSGISVPSRIVTSYRPTTPSYPLKSYSSIVKVSRISKPSVYSAPSVSYAKPSVSVSYSAPAISSPKISVPVSYVTPSVSYARPSVSDLTRLTPRSYPVDSSSLISGFGFDKIITTPSLPLLRPTLTGEALTRRYKGKRVTGYIPSYSALVFKMTGTYKPGRFAAAGLEFRPITEQFSISKMVKQFPGLRF